jgi:hypothetical protein
VIAKNSEWAYYYDLKEMFNKHEDEGSKTITISVEEYNRLVNAEKKLNCLESAGVDNWDWYDDAMESFHEDQH